MKYELVVVVEFLIVRVKRLEFFLFWFSVSILLFGLLVFLFMLCYYRFEIYTNEGNDAEEDKDVRRQDGGAVRM